MTVRAADPDQAARLFAQAGPGAALERFRLEAWLGCLERTRGKLDLWRQLVAAQLPSDLKARAELGLARELTRAGEHDRATAFYAAASRDGSLEAAEELVGLASGAARRAAATRLAVMAPQRLRRSARDLEREVLSSLDAAQWLERSVAWRRAGSPRQAAAELGSRRFEGRSERRRRLELARAEIEAGRPSRALRALARAPAAGPEEVLLRAEAHRRIGWARYPRSSASAAFRDCLAAARRGAAGADRQTIARASALIVECGTEAGMLDEALAAWWRLAAVDRELDRREWIGRRLGVALADRAGASPAVAELGRSLPRQARCLAYWSDAQGSHLHGLADAVFADLYGQWARERLGRPQPQRLDIVQPVLRAPAPPAVQWLLEAGAEPEARLEWRRIRQARGASPGEALVASRLEWAQGNNNRAVRWLLAGDADLGTVRMDRAPLALIRAYLPLEWEQELLMAARESGVDPWLLAGLARQESVFVAHARSPRSARGVLQVLPGTARGHAVALGLGRSPDLFDPAVNLRIGAREVARLQRRFGALEPALAAYNAGETRARRWWRQWPDRQRFTEAVPIPETYTYIRRVVFLAEAYRLAYAETWRER